MVTSAINHWRDLCLWVATQEAAHEYCCKRDASSRTAGAFSPNFAPAVTSRSQPELGRFESEAGSHAFNSLLETDGRGLMGLPTVGERSDSGRFDQAGSAQRTIETVAAG
jgi:hypothetical protein